MSALSLQRPITIVGSANMDLSIPTARMPRIGETVLGGNMIVSPGGKGANQVVAAQRASRSKGVCHFIGRVGDDAFGKQLRKTLTDESIDTTQLITTANTPSGTASIIVNPCGDNAIVVSPGANACLSVADIEACRAEIVASSVLAVQLEVPFETVARAMEIAREAGVLTVLDPAPAPLPQEPEAVATLPDALWQADIFSPNQTEAQCFTGIKVSDLETARLAGESLLRRGLKTVVIKLGAMGAAIVTSAGGSIVFHHVSAISVRAVNTTAAGDSFTGAMVAFLAEGRPLIEAVRLAGIAGSLACTREGALDSIPFRQEIFESSA